MNIHKISEKDVEVIETDFIKSLSIPIVYKRYNTPFDNNKQFVCKGKHQYRQQTTKVDNILHSKWICQCGKSL